MKRLAASLLGLALLTAPQTASAGLSCAVSGDMARQMAQLINAQRSAKGLRKLAIDDRLNQAAQAHACDMAKRGYFDHIEPNGSTPKTRVKRAGFRTCFTAENLSLDWRTPDKAMAALMASPGHRANILRRGVDTVGIGYVPRVGSQGPWFVQVFAKGC